MRVLIVGCGYVGLPLGAELVRQGHEVFGLRRTGARSEELTAAGLTPLTADITRLEDLGWLPGSFDWVVNTVSSTRGGLEEYRRVYLEGTRNLIHWLGRTPLQRYVYTSSTSVYGQTDGSVVDESSPTVPSSPTSQVLVETERLLLEAAATGHFPAVILRVAGIYGPGRGHVFLQYLRNEARLSGRGERVMNMVHRDDVVGAILAALERGKPGAIYNLADDEPIDQFTFLQWLSGTLGRELPPPELEQPNPRRKRGLTCKRVSNRKLKADLGYHFKYPTFREGYAAEIQRLGLSSH